MPWDPGHFLPKMPGGERVKEPEDVKLWHETMLTEFPERFQRLLAGPMWSGMGSTRHKRSQEGKIKQFLINYQLTCTV